MDRSYKGGVKAYWKRRGYYRLDAAAAQRRPSLPVAELGGGVPVQQQKQEGEGRCSGEAGRRRGWCVRRRGLGRRVLQALSPRRWLVRLRDAYVSAMLRLASSPAVVGCGAGAPYCAPAANNGFARPAAHLKEYDEKVLVEIYRSILARGGHLAVAAGERGGGVARAAARPTAATLRLPTVAQ